MTASDHSCACLRFFMPSTREEALWPCVVMWPAVCCVLVGVRWSQSCFNWCQAVLCEKAIRDAPRDRKPFIRGLPPGAGRAASPRLSHCPPAIPVPLPPSSLPLKISHRRFAPICCLPLPLALSWLKTLAVYQASSSPRRSASPSPDPQPAVVFFLSEVCPWVSKGVCL